MVAVMLQFVSFIMRATDLQFTTMQVKEPDSWSSAPSRWRSHRHTEAWRYTNGQEGRVRYGELLFVYFCFVFLNYNYSWVCLVMRIYIVSCIHINWIWCLLRIVIGCNDIIYIIYLYTMDPSFIYHQNPSSLSPSELHSPWKGQWWIRSDGWTIDGEA